MKKDGMKEIRCPHDCGNSKFGKLLFKCSNDITGTFEDVCNGRLKCKVKYSNGSLSLTPKK